MATQGYANYLKKSFPDKQVKVAIAHDSRNNSRFFAETTANVFAANGIKVYLFEACVQHLNCHLPSGIWVARVVWFAPHRTIQKNTMAIKHIGMMADNWCRRMIKR